MRVIGGEARGRSLKAPTSSNVRPTSDRVREAIFDVLMSLDVVEDASVLDAFAGSGALGIEALSRGAASATFVDSDAAAVTAVTANLARVGLGGRRDVRVVRAETVGFLAGSRHHYDLAFLDPPYRFAGWPEVLQSVCAATVVIESSTPVEVPGRFELHRVYRYGGTLVTVVTESAPPGQALDDEAGGDAGVPT